MCIFLIRPFCIMTTFWMQDVLVTLYSNAHIAWFCVSNPITVQYLSLTDIFSHRQSAAMQSQTNMRTASVAAGTLDKFQVPKFNWGMFRWMERKRGRWEGKTRRERAETDLVVWKRLMEREKGCQKGKKTTCDWSPWDCEEINISTLMSSLTQSTTLH